MNNDEEDDDDASQGIPLQGSGGDTGVPLVGGGTGAPGGAAGGDSGDGNDDINKMPPAQSKDEDSFEGQDGRDYTRHTAKGEAKMLINF